MNLRQDVATTAEDTRSAASCHCWLNAMPKSGYGRGKVADPLH